MTWKASLIQADVKCGRPMADQESDNYRARPSSTVRLLTRCPFFASIDSMKHTYGKHVACLPYYVSWLFPIPFAERLARSSQARDPYISIGTHMPCLTQNVVSISTDNYSYFNFHLTSSSYSIASSSFENFLFSITLPRN